MRKDFDLETFTVSEIVARYQRINNEYQESRKALDAVDEATNRSKGFTYNAMKKVHDGIKKELEEFNRTSFLKTNDVLEKHYKE